MSPIRKELLLQALAYLLWLVSIGACAFAFIQLSTAITVLWAMFSDNPYAVRLVGQVSLLVGGLIAFTYGVFLHGYYLGNVKRQSATQTPMRRRGRISQWLTGAGLAVLLRRFAVTVAVPLGVIALSLALIEVAIRAIR